MSSSDYTLGQVYEVDPATLTIGTNVRTDVRERDEFAQSIKAVGVLEPITAYADEDGALVVYRGQRRTVTAAKVGTPTGTVPVRVVERPEDAERIVAQVSENVHRTAMREAEERDAIEQLALLGVSAAQIAKRTASRRPRRTTADHRGTGPPEVHRLGTVRARLNRTPQTAGPVPLTPSPGAGPAPITAHQGADDARR